MTDFFNTDYITLNILHLVIFILYIAVGKSGIVFVLAGILFSLIHLPQSLYFLTGFALICGINFRDNTSYLTTGIRLFVQFVAIGLILFDLDVYYLFPWWLALTACIVCVGIINAYHTMDGIKGMTGLYSLVILVCLQYVNQNIISFVHPDFIIFTILACVVFLFSNAGNPAKCFAGNVGSIGIAFCIVVLLLRLILETDDIIWILFLAVYGVDMICKTIHRIYLKQNIFKPRQIHCQVWGEKTKWSYLWMPVIYAVIQLIVCIVVTYFRKRIPEIMLFSTLLGLLTVLYVLKFQHDFDD